MSKNKIIPLIIYPENNGYVNSLTPTINGTGEPSSSINVLLNNETLYAQVDELGAWSVAIDNALVDGQNYSLIAKQTDKDNNVDDTMVSFNVNKNGLPQHTITSPVNNGYINSTTPVISGSGKPGAIIEMTLKSHIYITNVDANGSWSIKIDNPCLEEFITVSVIQKDMGNISPALVLNFTIDTEAPSAPEIFTPNDLGYIGDPKPNISGQAESNATVNVVVDDKAYTTKADTSGKWNIEVSEQLSDDAHILSAKQQDLAGNISTDTVSIFNIDTVAPQAPVVHTPKNGQFVKTPSPTISGTGESSNRVEVKHQDKVYSALINYNGQWSLNITDTLSDGSHTFYVYQIDKAGNYSPSTNIMIKIETVAPLAPAVIYPLNEEYVNSKSFTIKGTGEPDAKIEIKLAGKTYYTNVLANGSWSLPIDDILVDGQNYSILASQIDLAGNVSDTIRVKFMVATNYLTMPIVSYPVNNSVINSEFPVIIGKCKANATINASINNITNKTTADNEGNWSITLNQKLPQGVNQLSITQTDMGNTSETLSISFTVDTVAPQMPIINEPLFNEIIYQNKADLNGTGEAGCTVDIKLDDKNYNLIVEQDNSWNKSIDYIDNGIHTIAVTQSDPAGNYSPCNILSFAVSAKQDNYTPDNKPATGTISYNPSGTKFTNMTIATLTTDKPVNINNIIGKVFTKVINSNGVYTFNFIDLEGNAGFVDSAVTWIDDTPPAVFIKYNGNYFSSDKTIEYNVSISGLKSALLNGIPFESGRIVNTDGYYTMQVTDNSGTVTTKTFVVDKTSPTIVGVENNGVYNSNVNISYFDNLSGIKSATLDYKPFMSGTTITAKGNHTLEVYDFGDNSTKINFTIN